MEIDPSLRRTCCPDQEGTSPALSSGHWPSRPPKAAGGSLWLRTWLRSGGQNSRICSRWQVVEVLKRPGLDSRGTWAKTRGRLSMERLTLGLEIKFQAHVAMWLLFYRNAPEKSLRSCQAQVIRILPWLYPGSQAGKHWAFLTQAHCVLTEDFPLPSSLCCLPTTVWVPPAQRFILYHGLPFTVGGTHCCLKFIQNTWLQGTKMFIEISNYFQVYEIKSRFVFFDAGGQS